MKSRPKKDQKTIFFSVEQFIVKTQFEISKYLLSIFMSSNICGAVLEDLLNLSPKLWRFEGKKLKESMVICEVLHILSPRPLSYAVGPIPNVPLSFISSPLSFDTHLNAKWLPSPWNDNYHIQSFSFFLKHFLEKGGQPQ